MIRAEQDDFYRSAGRALEQAGPLWQRTRLHREQTYLAEARTEQRDEADLSGGGYEEVALDLAEAVTSGRPAELIVNARNGSTIPRCLPGLIVETRCTVDAAGRSRSRGRNCRCTNSA